jgi:hypothetical protein
MLTAAAPVSVADLQLPMVDAIGRLFKGARDSAGACDDRIPVSGAPKLAIAVATNRRRQRTADVRGQR